MIQEIMQGDSQGLARWPAAGWFMDQQRPPEMQSWPAFPLLFGIDGRETGSLKRFRGFRRLDYDIREYNESGLSSEHLGEMLGWGDHLVARHNTSNSGTINVSTHRIIDTVIDFVPVRIEKPGKPPVVGFLIHGIESGADTPVLVFRGRELGDDSVGALFHSILFSPFSFGMDRTLVPGSIPTFYTSLGYVSLTPTDAGGVDRVGVVAIGRNLYVTNKYAGQAVNDTGLQPDKYRLARYSPVKVFSFVSSSSQNSCLPDAIFDKAMAVKAAGSRGHRDSFAGVGSTPHTAYGGWFLGATQFSVIGDSSEIAPHYKGAKLSVRIRFVNKTTGFVGPMSEPRDITLSSTAQRKRLAWATTGGNANVTATDMDGFLLLRSLVGGHVYEEGSTTYNPDTTVHDIRVQIFCTTSTHPDFPAHGGGVWYLDQEVPIVIQDTTTGLGYTITPSQHASDAGVPIQSNNELFYQEAYDEEFDDPGEISGGPALGELDGMLLSLDMGSLGDSTKDSDIGRWDIRVSPPWKYSPTAWLEAVAYRVFHRVEPTSSRVPKFLRVGSMSFFLSQNRLVRLRRRGSQGIYAEDVNTVASLSNREAADIAGSGIFLVTDSDIVELNPISGAATAIALAHRLISDRWSNYVRDGRMLVGYDPQLKAVFVSPRCDVEAITDPNADYSSTSQTHAAWQRNDALVIWLTTGKITMLHDCYWVGMGRGVHPITGKEHLFFIDPASNITYPDDYTADDAGQTATMTGINRFTYPNRVFRRPTATITVTGNTTGGVRIIMGKPGKADVTITEGVNFTGASGSVSDVATSIAGAINTAFSTWVTAVADADVVTVTAVAYGPWASLITLCNADNEPNLTFDPGTGQLGAGYTTEDHSTEVWGGVVSGAVTSVTTSGSRRRITDSLAVTSGKGTFDQYAVGSTAGTSFARRGALTGSQAYFFRSVTFSNGETRTVVIADGRIAWNTGNTFEINLNELTHRNDENGTPYVITTGDQYCLSPVVMQIIGAPVDPGPYPMMNVHSPVSVSTLGVAFSGYRGYAEDGATVHPVASTPLFGDVFLGVTTPRSIDQRVEGAPFVPADEKSVRFSNDARYELENQVSLGVHALHAMPVMTLYGTNYNVEVLELFGKIEVSPGGSPLGRS